VRVLIASDHGGFELKKELINELSGYDVKDLGPYKKDEGDDYPDYAKKVAETISRNNTTIGKNTIFGVLICKSAVGMAITANKFKNVRAVTIFNEDQAKHSRQHNDANVICISGETLSKEKSLKILKTWLDTSFSNEERHLRRLKKIEEIEKWLQQQI